MPETNEHPPRQAARQAPPPKRYRVLSEIVYGRPVQTKLRPGDIIDGDRPVLNYKWCLRHGHLEEVV